MMTMKKYNQVVVVTGEAATATAKAEREARVRQYDE